jgi:hypothetical protein
MKSYRLNKDDIVYDSEDLVVLIPELECKDSMTLPIELIDIGLRFVESGDCMFLNGIRKPHRNAIIQDFIDRLTKQLI